MAVFDLTEAEQEMFDERAGIYEFEGGLSRAEAEARALGEVRAARANLGR